MCPNGNIFAILLTQNVGMIKPSTMNGGAVLWEACTGSSSISLIPLQNTESYLAARFL